MIKLIDRIILLGTSHVAQNSVKEIEDAIDKYKPDVVGIELDSQRFKALMSENPDDKKKAVSNYKVIKELGVFGFLFAQIAGSVQKKVGKSINIDPGVDMKSAYLKAKKEDIPVALIDINIKKTMRKLSDLPFTKKIKLMSNFIFKSFKKEYRELLNFDLKSVPDDEIVEKMIYILEREVPDMYKILIDDRNKYMVDRLIELQSKHEGYIMAVVGAGHVNGMIKDLEKKMKKINVNNKKLSDNNVSFSFTLEQE